MDAEKLSFEELGKISGGAGTYEDCANYVKGYVSQIQRLYPGCTKDAAFDQIKYNLDFDVAKGVITTKDIQKLVDQSWA